MSMFLTDAEIDAICEGLGPTSHSAKCKRLASMGLIVNASRTGGRWWCVPMPRRS